MKEIYCFALIVLLQISCGIQDDKEAIVGKKTFAGTWTWSPKLCTKWGDPTPSRDVEISINKWQAKHLDAQGSQYYANNIYRPWRMLFSQNVQRVQFNFSEFEVEGTQYNPWDKLSITDATGTTSYTGIAPVYTAPTIDSPTGPFFAISGLNKTGYLDFNWSTDISTHYLGYTIDAIWLNCSTTSPTPVNDTWVIRNYPHDGYLLEAGDVIYVKTKQPKNYEMGFLLWPTDAVSDFDLFISTSDTNTKPSRYNNNGQSIQAAGVPEMVVLDAYTTGPDERWIYISIGSYSGSGQFRFYANVHSNNTTYARQTAAARTDFTPDSNEHNIIKSLLRKTSQAIYLATDGRHLIRNWTVKWNYATDFNPRPMHIFSKTRIGGSVCYNAACARPCGTGTLSTSHIRFAGAHWCGCEPPITTCQCNRTQEDLEVFAAFDAVHENGHCIYGFEDEYWSTNNCGHSSMNGGSVEGNVIDFCDSTNGGKDPWPGTTGHSLATNNWGCLKTRLSNYVPYPTSYTPDAFFKTAAVEDDDAPFNSPIVTLSETWY